MLKIFTTILLLFTTLFSFTLFPLSTHAAAGGLLTGLDQCVETGDCKLCDIVVIVNNVITLVLGLVGSFAFVSFIIAGGYLMFGGANKAYLSKATGIVKTSLIGLLIVFFSYAIVNFGLNIVTGQPISGTAQIFEQNWSQICN